MYCDMCVCVCIVLWMVTPYTHSVNEPVFEKLNIGKEDGRGYLEDFDSVWFRYL